MRHLLKKDIRRFVDRGIYTVGYTYDFNSTGINYYYYVGEKKYEDTAYSYLNPYVNSKSGLYYLVYDRNDPDYHQILFHKPFYGKVWLDSVEVKEEDLGFFTLLGVKSWFYPPPSGLSQE